MPSKVNSRVTLLHGRVFQLIRENVTLTNGITVDLDEDEMLNVHEVKVDNAIEMIHKGVIQDGKTIAGLFMALHWLKEKRWEY
ncbi:MAG: hypothetical protein L6406_24545 [Desulfobacterales bacterium]|nr:hypothetical protein [Desulfobacterales bacterium]